MTILGPTRHHRLNEGIGFVYLALGIGIVLSLISYHPTDLSWNTVGVCRQAIESDRKGGAHASDLLLQLAGLGAFTRAGPPLCARLEMAAFGTQSTPRSSSSSESRAWCSAPAPRSRSVPQWRPFGGAVSAGGLIGTMLADYLLTNFNTTGAILATALTLVICYLSGFQFLDGEAWLFGSPVPMAFFKRHCEPVRKLARHSPPATTSGAETQNAPKNGANAPTEKRASEASPVTIVDTEPLRRRSPACSAAGFQSPSRGPDIDRRRASRQTVEDKAPWEEEIPIRTLEESGIGADRACIRDGPEPVVVPAGIRARARAPDAGPQSPARKAPSSYRSLRPKCSTSRRRGSPTTRRN